MEIPKTGYDKPVRQLAPALMGRGWNVMDVDLGVPIQARGV